MCILSIFITNIEDIGFLLASQSLQLKRMPKPMFARLHK